jgi:CHAT domain-containing protein
VSDRAKATHARVETLLLKADYRLADSLLWETLRQDVLPEADQVLLLMTWASEMTLTARFSEAITCLQYCQHHHAKVFAQNVAARAHLVECLADIATEFQLTDIRRKAAIQLERAYALLDSSSERRTILARKVAVLHRMSKNQPAAHTWLAIAAADMNGQCVDRMRLLTEQAMQANKDLDFAANLSFLQQASTLCRTCPEATPEDWVQQLAGFAECYLEGSMQAQDPMALLQNEAHALETMDSIAHAYPQLVSASLALGLRRYANLAQEFGDYDMAHTLAHRALDLQLKRGVAPKLVSACYGSLGSQCHFLGQLDDALQYYSLSLLYYPQKEEPGRYIVNVTNYGQELIQNERYAEGEKYVRQAIDLIMAHDSTDHFQLGINYLNLAVSSDQQGHTADAGMQYLKAADLLAGNCAEVPYALVQAHIGAATQMLKLDSHAVAQTQIALGIAAIDQLPALVPMSKVFPLLDLANYYLLAGNLRAALETNHKLLQVVLLGYNNADPYDCPDLQNYLTPWYVLEAVDQKMNILWELYQQTGDQVLLQTAVKVGQRALTLLRKLRQERNNEGAKLQVNRKWRKLYENALRADMELYRKTQDRAYLHTAFEIAEQSRAMMLMEAIVENRVLENTSTTAAIATQKRQLQARMNIIRRQLSSGNNSPAIQKQLQIDLLGLQKAYDALLEQMQASNPKYFATVYDFEVVKVPALQAILRQDNRSLVEFFYGGKTIYTFVVTPDTFFVQELAFDQTLEANLKALTHTLQTIPDDVGPEAAKAYTLQSAAITDVLWQPIAPRLTQKLTIIPDGPLSFISFDALVATHPAQQEIRFQDLTYFLERYTIAYQYSATILTAPAAQNAAPTKGILAIAPSFDPRSKLAPLEQSQAGVEIIGADFADVDVLTDAAATKSAFLAIAADYKILEFATHGTYDRKNFLDSRIYFAADGTGDSLLTLRELYTMTMPADLAILEACETGLGDYHQGEGMMSLARGFTYAGCRSVLMSLWEVAEGNSTSAIIHGFYDHLAEGMPRDQAITAAKRDYLQSVRQQGGEAYWFMHPFYWSELVLIGEQGPLKVAHAQSKNPWKWWAPGIGVFLLALLWIARKRKLAGRG